VSKAKKILKNYGSDAVDADQLYTYRTGSMKAETFFSMMFVINIKC
jgi:hypothetical protein